ncbi:MAG: hypothetical protein RBQ97_01665 [Acholeplasma sp.]|nr:hypothetical protein [Acholeplasma sp.]
MKKIFLLLSLAGLGVLMVGCTKKGPREYTELAKDKVIVLADGTRYVNTVVEDTQEYYLQKVEKRTYTLIRNNVEQGLQAEFKHGEYWYHLETSDIHTSELLGNHTVKVETVYSYVIYTKDESISIKVRTERNPSFDFTGGWLEREYKKEVKLNGYFTSESALIEAIPNFKDLIKSSEKYFVDTTNVNTVSINLITNNQYYYFE